MIEFYVTTTGNYDPKDIENPSSAFILDYKNKSLEVMGKYRFDFQRIDASYLQLRDAGLRGLSIAGANNLFHDLIRRSEEISQRYVYLPNASIGYVSSSVGRLDASVSRLENSLQFVNGSVGSLESSVSSLETHLRATDELLSDVAAVVDNVDNSINSLERNMAAANTSINNISAVVGTALEPINSSISRLNTSVRLNTSSIRRLDSSVSKLELGLADTDASITNIKEYYIRKALIGRPNGVASLDSLGHVPASQLPSYVDDIIEGYKYRGVFYKESTHQTQIVPEGGKVYVDLYTGKTYRWGGTEYAIVSDTIAIGETEGTAFEGSRGVALEDAFFEHATDASIHVSETDRISWEDAAEKAHVHDNKVIIDRISQDDIDNWDDASAKRHVHDNKALLDAITDGSVNEWKNVNPDWNATSGDASIKNRPNLGEAALRDVLAGNLTNTTVSNNLVTATQVAEYGQTKMTAAQVASIVDASITALGLDKYTTDDEVAAIVDASIRALEID